MKVRLPMTIALLTAFSVMVGTVQALPPVSKEIKLDSKIKTTADENAMKHGMRVALKLKNKSRVTGTVVWADPADDSVLIRERPGAAPRKIPGKDIADVERIRLVGGDGTAKKDEPEIFKITEINGNLTTVKYYAPELSPGEKTQLKDMEGAENQAARTQYLMSQILDSIGDQAQALRYQRDMAAKQYEIMSTYFTEQSWLSSYSPYYPTPFFGGARPGMMFSQSYAGTGGILGGGSGAPATAAGMDSLMAKQIALEANLAKANQALTTARGRGLYEGGELIAVLPHAEPVVMPAADKGQ
jgi:hypothetical protein